MICQCNRHGRWHSEEHYGSCPVKIFFNFMPVEDEPYDLSCVSISFYPLSGIKPTGMKNEQKNLTPDLASDLIIVRELTLQLLQ